VAEYQAEVDPLDDPLPPKPKPPLPDVVAPEVTVGTVQLPVMEVNVPASAYPDQFDDAQVADLLVELKIPSLVD